MSRIHKHPRLRPDRAPIIPRTPSPPLRSPPQPGACPELVEGLVLRPKGVPDQRKWEAQSKGSVQVGLAGQLAAIVTDRWQVGDVAAGDSIQLRKLISDARCETQSDRSIMRSSRAVVTSTPLARKARTRSPSMESSSKYSRILTRHFAYALRTGTLLPGGLPRAPRAPGQHPLVDG